MNLTSDETSKLATEYKPEEIAFFRIVVRFSSSFLLFPPPELGTLIRFHDYTGGKDHDCS